jgi:hypothetical protein
MKNLGSSYSDRLQTAAKAKRALLEKARAKLTADDAERRAARLAIAAARDARVAERNAAKEAEQMRLDAERRAEEIAAEAAEEARKTEVAAAAAREADRASEQKAARDAKYAARKARQR